MKNLHFGISKWRPSSTHEKLRFRMAKVVLERELKDKRSVFWDFKILKAKKGGQGGYDHISVDDIQWLEASEMPLECVKRGF